MGMSVGVLEYSEFDDSGDEDEPPQPAGLDLVVGDWIGDWNSFPNLQHYLDVAEDLARPYVDIAGVGLV